MKNNSLWLVSLALASTMLACSIGNPLSSLFPTKVAPVLSDLAQYCAEKPDHCIAEGSATSSVIAVEVSDYGCSHCRDFNLNAVPLLQENYVLTNKVSWLVLPYALSDATNWAAQGAFCAAEQGGFPAYHAQMFQLQSADSLSADGIVKVAGIAGLDVDKFEDCLLSEKYRGFVNDNIAAATESGVTGTPTVFIGSRKFVGAYPFETYQEVIDAGLNP